MNECGKGFIRKRDACYRMGACRNRNRMKRYFPTFILLLRKWHILVGVEPGRAPACSIILFPLERCVLFCGFAGIMTIKGPAGKADTDDLAALSRGFAQVTGKGMAAFLAGGLSADHYLGGHEELAKMEDYVLGLKTDAPFRRLFFNPETAGQLSGLAGEMRTFLTGEEHLLDKNAGYFSTTDLELVNGRLVMMRDIVWGIERDILDNIGRIVALAGKCATGDLSPAMFTKYHKMNFLLNCLDRLEVRGRDSAGIQIAFTLRDASALDTVLAHVRQQGLHEDFLKRMHGGDLVDGSITCSIPAISAGTAGGTALSFTYKTSSIVGELGRNVNNLRQTIAGDRIVQEFARRDTVFESSLAHTRWASVGSITNENCHPVSNFTLPATTDRREFRETEKVYPRYGRGNWVISAVLNGDVDNYQSLQEDRERNSEYIAPEVTTDTKIIPLTVEKYLREGHDIAESFRLAVNDFEGAHAIALVSNAEPGKIFLALKGSGQAVYVGIAPDRYLFSSELYGLVEGTPFFLKMDGETPSPAGGPETAGQIFILNQDSPGGIEGLSAFWYDGTPVPLDSGAIKKAEITTRDIDRGTYPHYFLKEITESGLSVTKTLRGRYRISGGESDGRTVIFNLGPEVIPEGLRQSLREGRIGSIVLTGHGTAAVAGSAIAAALERYLKGCRIRVEARVASELSGFCLEEDLTGTLVIPVTQSGTTTDTNRAVAMVAERGATVIAIVNRRQSDITTKAAGVFYTSDGRDIEMSVASTKAFYSQIVAGHILGLFLAQILKTLPDDVIAGELLMLEKIPALMNRVLEKQDEIRASVEKLARHKKYWAVVGSGPNKAAADEIRIKLSELCYKTLSSDVVENKKHIDLSAEPLIIVCAAGNPETVMGDIVKDVAIFKAHKAAVVVFADEGEERFDPIADAVIAIPKAPLPLPVILNTVAGHLWGYYAARSIDEDALFLREFRARLNRNMVEHEKKKDSFYEMIADLPSRRMILDFTARFNERRNGGAFSLTGVRTISDMVLLLKYVAGKLPLEDFWQDFREADGFSSPLGLLDITLGHAIDELSRPIDAIRHQAKTVTVGTSRKEQPLRGIIFDLLKELEFSVKSLTSKNILAIGRVQPAILAIKGYTLYDINNLDAEGKPGDGSTISIGKRAGVSLAMQSRAEKKGGLMGTKKTIVSMGHVYIGYGKSDGAAIVIIPLLGERAGIGNLLLIHVDFNEDLSLREKKEVLGYRFSDIRNLVNEYNLSWDDRYLESIPLGTLLGEPVEVIAGRIREMAGGEEQS